MEGCVGDSFPTISSIGREIWGDVGRCGEMWGDVGDSFPTISSTGPNAISRSWEIWGDTDPCSASRPNAAVIHYHATHGACSLIDRESVYLCDTGGQYLDGTTDVTRTLHFGSPTADERRAYTRVLQARAPHSTPPAHPTYTPPSWEPLPHWFSSLLTHRRLAPSAPAPPSALGFESPSRPLVTRGTSTSPSRPSPPAPAG